MENNYAEVLEKIMEDRTQEVAGFSESVAQVKPGPQKWSKKEILGHLCDSAANNHKRFTDILQSEDPYKILPYNQNFLVAVNDYQNSFTFEEIINLWSLLNKQIIHVLRNSKEQEFNDRTIIVNGKEETYRWLAQDYIEHLQHHLKQITGH